MINKRQPRRCIVSSARTDNYSGQILLNHAVHLGKPSVHSLVTSKGSRITWMVSCLSCSVKPVSKVTGKPAVISLGLFRYSKDRKPRFMQAAIELLRSGL